MNSASWLLGLALSALPITSSAQLFYRPVFEYGPPGVTNANLRGFTQAGLVHGTGTIGSVRVAFIGTTAAGYRILPTPPSTTISDTRRGNLAGDLAGTVTSTSNVALLWRADGTYEFVGPQGVESSARDVNNLGEVCGSFRQSTGTTWAYVWSPLGGVRILAPAQGYGNCFPNRILDDGTVIGDSYTASNVVTATVWSPAGVATVLNPLPGGSYCRAEDAHSTALVIGWTSIANRAVGTARVNGVPTQIQVSLGSTEGSFSGVNSKAEVVGHSYSPNHALLWRNLTMPVIIEDLLDSQLAGWDLLTGDGISESGSVFGLADYFGYRTHYIAHPVYAIEVAVENVTANLGIIDGGDAFSFEHRDGDVLRMRPFMWASGPAQVMFSVSGHTPYPALDRLEFVLTGRMAQPSQAIQRLELFDFRSNRYDPVDVRHDTLTGSLSEVRLKGTGDVSRYRRSDGLYRARVTVTAVGPSANFGWASEHDYAQWILAP